MLEDAARSEGGLLGSGVEERRSALDHADLNLAVLKSSGGDNREEREGREREATE